MSTKKMKINSKDSERKAKNAYISDYLEKIRNRDIDDDYNSLLDEFLSLIGRGRSRLTMLSHKPTPERVYRERFEGDMLVATKLYPIAQRILHKPVNKYYLDIVFIIIQLLEMARHDMMIEVIKSSLMQKYRFIAQDFKLSDYYQDIPTKSTPDILFCDEAEKRNIIIEVKVTVKTDLVLFYEKYKRFVGDDLVVVINYNTAGFTQIGDIVIDTDSMQENVLIETINDFIAICSELRQKYCQLPESVYFNEFHNTIDTDDDFITGFKGRFEDNENSSIIKSLFGNKWRDIEVDIDHLSLITNKNYTEERLDHIRDDCILFCNDSIDEFNMNFMKNREEGLYTQTALHIEDLATLQDQIAKKTYTFTSKYRPSIYYPFIPGFEIGKQSRKNFYSSVFSKIKEHGGDSYTTGVMRLAKDLFKDDALEMLISPNKEKEEREKNKKGSLFYGEMCDINIYHNNAFSITTDRARSIKESICGFDRNRNDNKLKCLSYKDKSSDIKKVEEMFESVYNISYNNKSYSRDLNPNSHLQSDIEYNLKVSEQDGKMIDYLYVQHSMVKNLIALETVKNSKFRLIQTIDPCTICLMLPNSDPMKGSPIRYLTLSILMRDQNCKDIFNLNKKLGIAHSMVESGPYRIIISKVISMDLSRMKLLSNAFCKYTQLITYYNNLTSKIKFDTRMLAMLMSNMVTLSSLSITENFKNIMMVCYSTFSNPDELIKDKLECRPTTFSHIYIMNRIFTAIEESPSQRSIILRSLKTTKINDQNEIIDTGFNSINQLIMPISKIKVYNPKEILQESYLLFYLGNKGLHGSPQELLKLYHTPVQFEREYEDFLKDNEGTILQGRNNTSKGIDYNAMRLSTLLTYSSLRSQSDTIRTNIKQDLALDESILTKSQFSSTKSMVTQGSDQLNINNLNEVKDLRTLESYIKNSAITNENEFVYELNKAILSINHRNFENSKSKVKLYGDDFEAYTKIQKLPDVAIKTINGYKFIVFKDFKKEFIQPVNLDIIKQHSAKVFDCVIEECDRTGCKTLRDFYDSNYMESNDIIIKIFYKDQRSFNDREIYTGNLTCRLCLYPVETLFKTINKMVPQEAISIAGEKKHKKMYDQRIDMLKKRKHYNKKNQWKTDILSVSCDASKWSARDVLPKFIIPISTNIFLTPEEKWFYIYLITKYYKKFIVLTDNALYNILRFQSDDVKITRYEDLTANYSRNYQVVTSNWLQGNLNATSSFVHCCCANLMSIMLECLNSKYSMNNYMDFLCHSDDSCYDFLIMRDSNSYVSDKFIGTFLYTLIQWSTLKHCIVVNRKKTYISNFYKEFLSTLIIGNELFYFYLSDLLPISSDVTYDSPVDDLASFSGYINNAFMHAAPMTLIKVTVSLINHLVLATYNLNASSKKSPYNVILGIDSYCSDMPISVLPRYKIPIDFAGLIPYNAGDPLKVLNRIIEKMNIFVDKKSTLPFSEIFTLELITRYLEVEDCEPFKNYIKMCLMTTFEDYLLKDQEDPYTLYEKDTMKQNLLSVIPTVKNVKPKNTYTYNKFKENEDGFRKLDALNPMWCIANPRDHTEIRDRLLSNYNNKKFINSLIFSRPQYDYARRIITSNAKIYRYNLSDDYNLMTISEIYEKLKLETKKYIMTPEKLLNYLQLSLFTDQQTSAALHLYHCKEEVYSISRDRADFRIVIPKSIYQPEYGRYSITTIIRDIVVENKSIDVDKIDQKTDTLIGMAEMQLEKINLKMYEYPEDIDDDFKTYINAKYKFVKNYEDFLIKNQEFGDYSNRVYRIKCRFQALQVKYYNDFINGSNIDYTTPRSFLMTLNSFMLRDRVTSKLFIGTKSSRDLNDYLLNRLGMYKHEGFIINYKVSHKIHISVNDQVYSANVNKRYNDDMHYLSYIRSKVTDEVWNDISQHGVISGQPVFRILQDASLKINDIHKTLFLKRCNFATDHMAVKSLMNTNYTMNHWVVPTDSGVNFSEVNYHISGVFLNVKVHYLGDKYHVNMRLYKPNLTNIRITNLNHIVERLISKFRMDYKNILHNVQHSRDIETDWTVYIKGLNVTMRYDPENRRLCNIKVYTYTSIDVASPQEDHGFILTLRNERYNSVKLEFIIKNRNIIEIPKLFDYITELRGLDHYDDIILMTNICKYDRSYLASEYTHISHTTIQSMFNNSNVKYTNFSKENISKLYNIVYMDDDETSIAPFLKKIAKCLSIDSNLYNTDKGKVSDLKTIRDKLNSQLIIDLEYHEELHNKFQYEIEPYSYLFELCSSKDDITYQEFCVIFIYMLLKYYYIVDDEVEFDI
uniref:RNA-directed RNA polymerase L n=1 Tax=Palo verde broom virus TaxID=2175800 RepID=A0A2S1R388_9VIRU|nr:RNA-dependent RNA polymerase [Palo verde broom virus]